MQFKTNVGAEVQKYLERYDDASNILKPHGKTILRLDWTGINPDYEVIGEGTYSIVHKVKLLDGPNTFYALKFLDPNMMKDNSGEERYKRAAMDICFEGKILERLDHQNIVSLRGIPNGSVEDSVNDESFPYFLLLDYLPLTLDHVLQQKRKSTKERLFRTRSKVVKRLEQIAVGIVSAMEYMHERGLLFRDLKPSNVGFDSDGHVKLFDFGNCRDLEFVAKSGESLGFAGTPRYMATEIGAGNEYGLPSDVYSFGILLWEIITLRVPFESIQTIEEFQHEVVQCHQRPNLSYVKSENLRALLEKCWDPEPMQRPSFQEIREELELFIKAHEEKNSTNQNEKKQGPRRINTFLRRFSMGKEHQVSET